MSSATETDFVIEAAPVIPVVVLEDASKAHDLAAALVAGGLPCIEITLSTPAAMDAGDRAFDAGDGGERVAAMQGYRAFSYFVP